MKILAETEIVQLIKDQDKVFIHHKMSVDSRADMVMQMLRSWGMVAAREATSDDKNATKEGMVVLSPAELVERACEVVDLAWNECLARGWILRAPPYEDC